MYYSDSWKKPGFIFTGVCACFKSSVRFSLKLKKSYSYQNTKTTKTNNNINLGTGDYLGGPQWRSVDVFSNREFSYFAVLSITHALSTYRLATCSLY